jgi:hypothetical protein
VIRFANYPVDFSMEIPVLPIYLSAALGVPYFQIIRTMLTAKIYANNDLIVKT